MLGFFNKAKSVLGLDISDVSLKFIQFEGANKKIQAYSDETLPTGAVSGDKIGDPKLLVKAIRDAIAKPKFGKVTTPYVVASLPETKCFVRAIQIPFMTEKEAAEAVPWEAEAYVPMPMSQVYLDWMILPGSTAEGKMTVLITAAPKDYVDTFLKVLKEAGLKPVALEVESHGTARSLVADPAETVLMLDIDTARSSFIIFSGGNLQFTSSVPIAGNLFTETIAKTLGVDPAAAEKLKRENGLEEAHDGGAVKKALLPVLENLISETKKTIKFFEEHSGAQGKISRVLLSGGSSKLKHLPSFMSQHLLVPDPAGHNMRSVSAGLKVELGNPWAKVLEKGVPPISREDSLSYATAIGLAMREDA